MIRKLLRLLRAESAVTAIEYALLASLIAVAIVAGVTALGVQVDTLYKLVYSTVQHAAA